MDDLADPLTAHRRHTDEVEDARPLGLGSHHAVECGQLTDRVCGHQHRTTSHACVPIGRIRRVQFVRTANPANPPAPGNGIVELECEVPGDSEAVRDSLACEPSDNIIRDSIIRDSWLRRIFLTIGFFSTAAAVVAILITSTFGTQIDQFPV